MEPKHPGGNGPMADEDNPRFTQRVDQMNQTAHQFVDEARGAAHQLGQSLDLKGRVERHPYAMVLTAMGVGYVLGGGLFTPFTARMLRFGMKLAALPLVKDELLGFAEGALDNVARARAATKDPHRNQGDA
jgi:hypothetical protein